MELVEGLTRNQEDRPKPLLLGTFPAHLVHLEPGQKFNQSLPYNYVYKIAPEAKEMTGTDWTKPEVEVKDGEEDPRAVSADYLVGRHIRSTGVWLNLNPRKGESWRNDRYIEWNEVHGVKFPLDKNKVKQLGKVEPSDVLGAAVMVTVELVHDKRSKRDLPKVTGVGVWEDGEPLDTEEILAIMEANANPVEADDEASEEAKKK